MELFIWILVGVALAGATAYLVVKHLPLKMRPIASSVLLLLAIFYGYKIYKGIMEPINFAEEKVERFDKVIDNLRIIRDAEIRHYQVKGSYTSNKVALIQFIDSAQIALTETRDTVFKKNIGQRWSPLWIDVEEKITDTIGYEAVLKYFKDRDYKNMFQVPGVEGKEFILETGSIEKVPGLVVSTFEAKTEKKDVLDGLPEHLVNQELEAVENSQIKGEYVSVGSLNEVSTGGNWPPSYNKKLNLGKNKNQEN